MFQFPALASCYARCHSFRMTGCPIRKSSDQRLFAPARSLSQLITSFIASESQGIRHAPLLTFFQTFYSRTGIGSGIASFYQYCILEHVRFDIYFQLLLLILLFVHHVKDRFSFSEMLKLQTSEYTLPSPFTNADSMRCFLKPEGIVLSMPAIHASGSDHFEAELLYSDIQDYYLPEQIYWNE